MTTRREQLLKEAKLLYERQRRDSDPLYAYKPCSHPERNQLAFHQSRARIRLVTGGNQSGKSISGAAEVAYTLLGVHPYQPTSPCPRIFCLSASYRTIQEGIWRHLDPHSRINGQGAGFLSESQIVKRGPNIPGWQIPSYIQVYNNINTGGNAAGIAQLDFLSAEGGKSARRRLQSAAVDDFFIDEEVEEILWNEINMRLLVKSGRIVITCTLVESEQYLLDIEERGALGGTDASVHLTRLNTDYNEHIDEGVRDQIFLGMSDEEQQVRRYGYSRSSEGRVYKDFGKQHICEPFPIPQEWPRFMAMDPGFRTFAGLWIAINPDTLRAFIYREMYLHETDLEHVAKFIYSEEQALWDPVERRRTIGPDTEIISTRWIDKSAFSHYTSGEVGPGIQLASKYDIISVPSDSQLHGGIEAVKGWMKPGLDSEPMLKIWNTLRNFKNEIRKYKYKREDSTTGHDAKPDRPIKKHDHLMDCLRYLAMGIVGVNPDIRDIVEQSRDNNISGITKSSQWAQSLNKRAQPSEIQKHVDKLLKERNLTNDRWTRQ